MHVDGFRFDLASVLSRDADGQPDAEPAGPLGHRDRPGPGRARSSSPRRGTPAGLYQVGSFVGDRWAEWNGRFRDDVRAFVKGDPGIGAGASADRFLGSPDIYGHKHRDAQSTASTS